MPPLCSPTSPSGTRTFRLRRCRRRGCRGRCGCRLCRRLRGRLRLLLLPQLSLKPELQAGRKGGRHGRARCCRGGRGGRRRAAKAERLRLCGPLQHRHRRLRGALQRRLHRRALQPHGARVHLVGKPGVHQAGRAAAKAAAARGRGRGGGGCSAAAAARGRGAGPGLAGPLPKHHCLPAPSCVAAAAAALTAASWRLLHNSAHVAPGAAVARVRRVPLAHRLERLPGRLQHRGLRSGRGAEELNVNVLKTGGATRCCQGRRARWTGAALHGERPSWPEGRSARARWRAAALALPLYSPNCSPHGPPGRLRYFPPAAARVPRRPAACCWAAARRGRGGVLSARGGHPAPGLTFQLLPCKLASHLKAEKLGELALLGCWRRWSLASPAPTPVPDGQESQRGSLGSAQAALLHGAAG